MTRPTTGRSGGRPRCAATPPPQAAPTAKSPVVRPSGGPDPPGRPADCLARPARRCHRARLRVRIGLDRAGAGRLLSGRHVSRLPPHRPGPRRGRPDPAVAPRRPGPSARGERRPLGLRSRKPHRRPHPGMGILSRSVRPRRRGPLYLERHPGGGLRALPDDPDRRRGTTLVASGDFNGDGVPDLASPDGVKLGLGDGTFGSPSIALPWPDGVVPGSITSIAVFRPAPGGSLDLAVTLSGADVPADPGSVVVFPGAGDGTFRAPASYPAGIDPMALVAADFRPGGAVDLAVVDAAPDVLDVRGSVSPLRGLGDGTFRSRATSSAGAGPTSPSATRGTRP